MRRIKTRTTDPAGYGVEQPSRITLQSPGFSFSTKKSRILDFQREWHFSLMQVNHSEIAAASCVETASATCPVLRSLSAIVFLAALPWVACRSEKPQETPSITFTRIPPAAQGGRERVDTISGRVKNARPKQQIVIYAHSGQW